MGINLQKGQRISLTKEAPTLSKLMCGLGWDIAQKSGGGILGFLEKSSSADFDLDASVLCLNAQNKLTDTAKVIYYANLSDRSNSITHLGDNLTGEGDGDDEQIIINLPLVPTDIHKLVLTVNIYQSRERNQDFSQIQNAFVRLVDTATLKELARYSLSGTEYQGMTGMIMAEIYRHNGEWKIAAIGDGIKVNGLKELVKLYV